MTDYHAFDDAIEGRKIICVFEDRPFFGIEKESKRQQVAIRGNPATAILSQVWQYKKV
jgi:hypothetical protein